MIPLTVSDTARVYSSLTAAMLGCPFLCLIAMLSAFTGQPGSSVAAVVL
jgi:hypothetical protein